MAENSPAQGRSTRSSHPVALETLPTLSLALLALGWFVFPLPLHPPDPAPSRETGPHLSMEQVDSLTTDPSGRLHRRLRADELRRMVPGAKSMLLRPRLTIFPEAGPSWRFEAESGEVSPDGKNIYLPGPVQGRRDAVEPLEVAGRDFRIMDTNGYGESDEPATVRGASFEARGTGVKMWMEEGRIELLSDAGSVMRPR